ncbi:hypothetical protein A5886_002061 [Enterococcus sp. 8G7_MSG3316]|uniref:Membrane protein 6-pyruvoyl-tetrahydropterin synthase-related domain-containing protein n=1 Tax=Candidatus Enterococcus testudinis TaxID=1834191 RepID=A0A242A7Q5_9ENTE|nr:hypothetical protein [Enterococcus sp. 8G7_MSG3316]OTN76982.1 hypothetical protein A5886_002061 [Enterococcus sp. 8G7_MSG3316]
MSYFKKYQFFIQIMTILLAAFLLTIPQVYLKGFVIGSDAMFHFNRFYDASEQIKHGNFQYFITMYGFQQSGRIVNAMYGPIFAYFQGVLVLISNSWFHYQIISNFLIYLLSGLSMFALLKKIHISGWLSVGTGIFFMTTYPIQYWIDQQGLSAWPSAILPLCLIPLVKLVDKQKLDVLGTSISIGIMFQIHVLSTLFLVLIYFCFFTYIFVQSQYKKRLMKQLCISIVLFMIITMNVWLNMLDIYRFNQLVPPFFNNHMENNTITANSAYWIRYPKFLPILFAVCFSSVLDKRHRVSPFLKVSVAIIVVFTVLATNFFPWKTLSSLEVPFLGLLQFPFRFIVFGIVLLLISIAMIVSARPEIRLAKPIYLFLLLGLSLLQVTYQNTSKMIDWHLSDTAVNRRVHSYVFVDDERKMKDQLFSSDKEKILESFQKSAPDYLPLYKIDQSSKYGAYGDDVIKNNHHFDKKVEHKALLVTWQGDQVEKVKVPVIKYERTQLVLNGQKLEKDDYSLSTIGVVSLNQKIGQNELTVTYKAPWFFMITLLLPALFWIAIICYYLKKMIRSILN